VTISVVLLNRLPRFASEINLKDFARNHKDVLACLSYERLVWRHSSRLVARLVQRLRG